jgi:hypothetical protein
LAPCYLPVLSNAGINQRQLQHYASGLKKPREAQVKKIESALHKLGEELMSIEM